ncbi:protein translocase subunit SecDF [Winogradskyella alexanderae]|uniref:Multifunctional fusion protein n=1 Tax=Winogradskyella alexanderae TaxID=2877123 RepID=A0ABS7XUX9_9FLAO|nr:protein translocase subunit SecDF [Winogradskyella alexanderae]MCA0133825.1 protein translocase subunit SecDF [Winogradskyella alexanderae]
MQNKGIIKLFALLFGLVSIYQLSFTFKANQIEDEAKAYAVSKFDESVEDYQDKRNQAEIDYLDSLKTSKIKVGDEFESIEVYNMLGISQFSYSEVEDNAMKLGLDLKGGINAIIQISVKDILKGLANNSKDPVFNKALDDAEELQKDAQESYLESFFRAFDAIKGDTKLASPDIFANRDLSDVIKFDMTDDEVKSILETKIDESIVSAFEVLRNRIDGFGVSSPNIQRLGNSGRILIELPGAKDKKRVVDIITKTAQLQFWETYKMQEVLPYILEVNQNLVEANKEKEGETSEVAEAEEVIDSTESAIDELTGQIESDSTDVADLNPLGIQSYGNGGSVVAMFLSKDREKVLAELNNPKNRSLLPAEMRYAKFVWGIQQKDSEFSELYAIKGNRDGIPPLSGSVITDATQDYDPISRPAVSMQMNAKGSKIWEEMTKVAFETQGFIAIVLDDIVYSAPSVSNGPIAGGRSQISGSFTLTEAIDLANVLRAGKLPASAEIVQADEVGPSLGQEAIDSGMKSFLIALVFVLLWMIFYYGKAGIFADAALLLNILLIFGVLASLGAVLTLPGIAGIVLTIGISVDANVLIFERIREEIAKGKSQKESIKDGFANALSSILDANITTGLTALILFVFGTGPIKGFATTLIIGIVTSLFTAIFITRLLIDWWVNRGGKLDFSTAMTKNLFKNVNINFLIKRKIAYVISGVLLATSIGSLFTTGLDQGIDFVGGRTYQVRFEQPVSTEEITSVLNDPAVFGSAEVKTIGAANQLKISTKYKVEDNSVQADDEVQSKLFEALKPYLPSGMTYQEFQDGSGDAKIGKMLSSKVSPTIADDIKKSSFWAVLGSLVVVFLYILIRFKKWQFSLGAVAAVFHDVLIVLGIFSLTWRFMPFSMEIDQAFIAAILTVIGYSLNDTVVVFDRIREFLNEHTSWEFGKTINASLNSTLSRTLNTSVTTLVVLLAMFIFGADSLRGLLFALIVGVIVGTYSSMFIATPLMYDTAKKGDAAESLKKKVKEEDEE